jgi:hypothetical protein
LRPATEAALDESVDREQEGAAVVSKILEQYDEEDVLVLERVEAE